MVISYNTRQKEEKERIWVVFPQIYIAKILELNKNPSLLVSDRAIPSKLQLHRVC